MTRTSLSRLLAGLILLSALTLVGNAEPVPSTTKAAAPQTDAESGFTLSASPSALTVDVNSTGFSNCSNSAGATLWASRCFLFSSSHRIRFR